MKTIRLIFLTISCLLVLTAASKSFLKEEHKASKKHRQPDMFQPVEQTKCIILFDDSEFCRHPTEAHSRHGDWKPQYCREGQTLFMERLR